jgi:hypothetical protein
MHFIPVKYKKIVVWLTFSRKYKVQNSQHFITDIFLRVKRISNRLIYTHYYNKQTFIISIDYARLWKKVKWLFCCCWVLRRTIKWRLSNNTNNNNNNNNYIKQTLTIIIDYARQCKKCINAFFVAFCVLPTPQRSYGDLPALLENLRWTSVHFFRHERAREKNHRHSVS